MKKYQAKNYREKSNPRAMKAVCQHALLLENKISKDLPNMKTASIYSQKHKYV